MFVYELLFYRNFNYSLYYTNNIGSTFMTRKNNTMLIGLLGTILMGLATWTLVTLIELQTLMYMLQTELENVDKQFGRVYNFIDSVRGR